MLLKYVSRKGNDRAFMQENLYHSALRVANKDTVRTKDKNMRSSQCRQKPILQIVCVECRAVLTSFETLLRKNLFSGKIADYTKIIRSLECVGLSAIANLALP